MTPGYVVSDQNLHCLLFVVFLYSGTFCFVLSQRFLLFYVIHCDLHMR